MAYRDIHLAAIDKEMKERKNYKGRKEKKNGLQIKYVHINSLTHT